MMACRRINRSDTVAGLTIKNSPASAIISPMMNMVPMITNCSLPTDHDECETEIESVGRTENTVTKTPKKTQLISR